MLVAAPGELTYVGRMILLEFSMYPVGEGESLSQKVSRSIDIVDQSGLPYQTHAMGTTLEGEWDEVMDVVKRCYLKMREDSDRISASIKLDYRKGKRDRLTRKVKSIEEKLGRPVKK